MKNFIEKYKIIRQACGLTQADCAKIHHVDIRTICRWESGQHSMPKTKFYDMLNLYLMVRHEIDAMTEAARKKQKIILFNESNYKKYVPNLANYPYNLYLAVIRQTYLNVAAAEHVDCPIYDVFADDSENDDENL